MNIKSRLFKQAWEHRDPAIRAEAVRESEDPNLKAELGRLAEHDESATVRLAALKRINTEAFWLDARLRETDPAIVEAADAFLARAIMQKPNPDMLKERREWFARIDNAKLVRNVACHAPDESMRADALERTNAQGFLGDCYVDEASEELAEALLARIEQESTLERIIARLRKVNKSRARAAQRRLVEVRRAAGKEDPSAESALELVEQIEALARGDFEGDRRRRLDELEADWESLGEVSDALRRRFSGAADIIRRSLDHPSGNGRTQAETAPAEPGDETPGGSGLAGLAEKLQAAADDPATDDAEITRLLSAWDRQWNHIDSPTDADRSVRENILPAVRALQKRHESTATGRENESGPPHAELDQLGEKLDEIAGLLEQGHIAEAHEALRETRSRHDRLKPGKRHRKLSGRLHRLEGRLAEMRRWQHWSNNQVREELIAQVDELAESGQHPDAITAALKQAREEWNRLEKLEVLPGDKRRHAAPPGQWRRFQAACKNAFEKARPFFEKRHRIQDENLALLEAFLEKGNELLEREDANGEELVEFMRKSRQAIRRLDDLPPKSRGASATKLRELMDGLSSRLDTIYEEIEQTKRRLVAEARELAHERDLKTAISRAKELQARWQRAGHSRRRTEQKLWKEFREPIDPLFEQLRGQQEEQRQQHDEQVAELESLCEQAETLAALDEAGLPDAEGRFRGLSDDWHSRQRRPKGLNSRFEQAERTFNHRLAELRRKEQEASRQRIEALARSIQEIWHKRSESGASGLEKLIAGIDDDSALISELSATAQRFADENSDDRELFETVRANAETARHVVVELEFLAGIESPAEDRDLRMDYQVQRLARRLGERDRQPDLASEFSELTERWFRSFPHPVDLHSPLAKRFEKCQNVVRSMIGK